MDAFFTNGLLAIALLPSATILLSAAIIACGLAKRNPQPITVTVQTRPEQEESEEEAEDTD